MFYGVFCFREWGPKASRFNCGKFSTCSFHVVLRKSITKCCRLSCRPFCLPSDMCNNKRLWWHETQNSTSQPARSNEKSLLERLIVPQPDKNYSAVYGSRRFVNVSDRSPKILPILSQINPLHDCPSCLCNVHCTIILLSISGYSQWSFPFWPLTTTTHSNMEDGFFFILFSFYYRAMW